MVNRLSVKMALAFALVAIITVVAVGFGAEYAVRSEFGNYLSRVRERQLQRSLPPESVPPPGVPEEPAHPGAMRRMMGPSWATGLVELMGVPERRFLNQVRSVLWQVGAVVALLGAGAGAMMASGMTARLKSLARRALSLARAEQRGVPVAGDEVDQLETAFHTMERALSQTEERRRRLLADIAHELKTPLAVVQANLESFLDGVNEPTPERVAALHTQVALLNRLVTELRDLAMAEAGELTLERRPVDLRELTQGLVDLWQPRAAEAGVHLEMALDAVPPVRADPDRLGQLLINLLSNALRHAPPGRGWIRVGLTRRGPDEVALSVEDNGPGIDPRDLPFLFDHFYRADPSRTRASGGWGIGLAVVRSVAEAHGGRVSAENRREGGARFVVTLPVTAQERPVVAMDGVLPEVGHNGR